MTESSRIRVDGDAIRVYVVEEMKYGFCATEEYLKTHPDIQVVGKSASLPKAIEEICNMKPQPEIVITEIEFRHPDMDGISLLERVKQHNPRVRLIMVAAFSKPELPWLASVLGAEGFLYHGSKPFRLASAIRTVHSGWPAWDDEPSLQVKEWSDKRITYDERLLLEEFANHPASNKVLATRL